MKETLNNITFTWNYVKDKKKTFIKYILLEIVTIFISVIVPILSAKIIIHLTDNNYYQLMLIAIMIFLVENVRNITNYLINKYSQILYRETLIKIQYDLGKYVLKIDNKSLDKKGSGVFIHRLSNDTTRLSDVFTVATNDFAGIISDIGIFLAVFIISKIAFVFLVIETIILYTIERIRIKKYIESDKIYRTKSEDVSGFSSEMIRGARDIKMLNAEDSFLNVLRKKIFDQNLSKYKANSINRKYTFIRGFLRDLSDLLLIILLVSLIMSGNLEIASALIVYNYSNKLPSIINYLGRFLDVIKDFNLSASRIKEIIDSDEFSKESFGNIHLNHVHGDFEFKNVNFSYDNEDLEVLHNLSFKVNANETVGFVGKSGAGKSTIFSLLCKMYDIQSGTITIDGININDLDKDSIRGNITIISQNPYIFNMSIKDNLKLVKKNLTKKEMIDACKNACLDDFIESLPNKYDTIVGEGGVSLSGGQRQRLAIARALVQKTEIILFDEATSALDNETQSKIQKAINHMKGEYTILIIAHRLSTIMDADRILVVDKGKIVGEGTHKSLLKTNKTYKKLYENEIKEQ